MLLLEIVCNSFTVNVMKFICFVLAVALSWVSVLLPVQLLLLSPVLSPILWSFLYNVEVAFMFSVLFLVFWNDIEVPVTWR